ncbi:Wilms tumor protein 1-interacting protein isoform X3 [Anopheles cruzii]|uniref:Wilms tumor protein 1-interacting protein isoform X3 n=1 Tax=Anopheles cruzii TaxID=68878 RepID=UPI0022EC652C|nr:Wilms tumor protein 1-interacting protein isoform X3 [Anopheles cruzii]
MGVMLSVLVASVGAMDLIYCLAYVSNQVTEGPPPTTDDGAGLEQYRKAVSEQLTAAPRSTIEGITVAQDGVPYRDGYRVEQFDEARLDALGVKIRDLERRSQEKEQRLEQLNVALRELERKSVERELQGRSRPVSRAPSPERPESGTGTDVLVASPTLPQIVLDDGGGGGAGAEPRPSSSKFRPIRRDDETRRSVKRRSVASNASQDDRAEELLLLSQLEEEEAAHMQDYVPLTYARDEHSAAVDAFGKRHKISPIPELCQMHEDEDRQWVPERSPEPTLAANITRPWGDIKMDEVKERAVIARRSARSLSIEEVETPRHSQSEGEEESRPGPQLRACETVPANLSRASSRSVSPDHAEQPTLRRTTKETDLASLLLLTVPDGADRKLIFSGEYTKAMSKDWHSGHFCCWQCDESLTGQRYVLRDEHPYCIKCYENVFANVCEECNKTIGIDSKDLSYKDKHWHEACFLCNKCRISLVDKQFGSKADKIYCGNCYDAQFASRCDGCGEIFRAGTKKMEYKTRQWHEKCFCCCVCKTAIGTKSFIPREQEIYCAGCYEEKYATRCIKCKKIITSGGVTYKNEPWHRECFTCTHCQVSLAGQRFTSRDEKPYCAECFGELFAKRCTSCTKPITGIGGTRFISFEDRHWHNDCFICAICKTSLVGRGFITDEQDVICPECAKQKLM